MYHLGYSCLMPISQFPIVNGLCILLEDGAFDILIIIPITSIFRLLKRAIAFLYPL